MNNEFNLLDEETEMMGFDGNSPEEGAEGDVLEGDVDAKPAVDEEEDADSI